MSLTLMCGRTAFVLAHLLFAVATTEAGLAPGDWPMFGRNPQFQSYIDSVSSTARGAEWRFNATDRVVSSPSVAFGRVFFGSDDGHLYCVSQATGDLVWSFLVPAAPNCSGNYCEHGLCACNKIRSTPAIDADGNVYFGAYDYSMYKLDRHGKLVWSTKTAGAFFGSPTIDVDGTVFIGSFDGNLYSFHPTNGSVNWKFDLAAHGDVGWAIEGDVIVGQSNEGGNCTVWPPPDVPNWPTPTPGGGHCYVYALDKHSGKLLWKSLTGHPGGGGTVADGVYFNCNWNKNVTAFDVKTGEIKWQYESGGTIESHPAYHAGVLYISTEENKLLLALNAQTGEKIWEFSHASEELNSSPAVTADTVYVGSNDQYMYALDVHSGKCKFKFKTCANVFGSPAVDDKGMVYISCNTETGPVSEQGVGAAYAINPNKHGPASCDGPDM